MDAGQQERSGGRHRSVLGAAADATTVAGSGRVEEGLGPPGREDALRVRWRGPRGRESVTAEMQLLAALEVAGIAASPDVLGIEEDGYIRETAPALVRRRGRRAADGTAPATGERLAQARARDDLETLLAALHERGWVLGAPRGRGLGVREGGGVIVLDLSGLRHEESLSARSADLRWIDSVLEDEERTLRRRVHERSPGLGAEGIEGPGLLDVADPPDVPEPFGAPGAFGVAQSYGAQEPSGAPSDGSAPPHPVPGRPAADAPSSGAEAAAGDGASAAPRLRRARSERRAPVGEETTAPTRRRRRATTITRVLAEPRHRRTAALSAAAVLVLGLGTGLALGLSGEQSERDSPVVASAPGPGDGHGTGTAPPIEDPWALAADLAGSRHAYLTGASEVPVATEGGTAQAEDERIRAAYEGYEVRGSGPVVHEAELLSVPDAEGRAVLRVISSSEPGQVVGDSGPVQETPGGTTTDVELTILWDGQRWRIEETHVV